MASKASGNTLQLLLFYSELCVTLCDFPGGSDGKVSAYNAGDPGSISGLGRSSGKENSTNSVSLSLCLSLKGAES